jgi:hypothetical protein
VGRIVAGRSAVQYKALMPDYCFRIRFRLAERLNINSPAHDIPIADPVYGKEVVLKSAESEKSIAEAKHLALIAKSYESEQQATAAGEWWKAVLQTAFARVLVGADFGARGGPTSTITEAGKPWFREQFGVPADQPIVDDDMGVTVFECEPWPRFARSEVAIQVGRSAERVSEAIAVAARLGVTMPTRDELAYELFSASFSQDVADGRFIMLVMAIEALIEAVPRAPDVVAHVDGLIRATNESSLPKGERDSIVGTLRWARQESIKQAGRRVVQERLGDRTYERQPAATFFSRCYAIRSDLVHGNLPRPSWAEVNALTVPLERFVSELLSPELLDEVAI